MLACKSCGGFPAQVGDQLLSCCYLAQMRALSLHTRETNAREQWALTRKHREAKWAEYAAMRAVFARRGGRR